MAVRCDSAAAPLFADLITKIKFRIISKDLWLPAKLLVAFQERFSKKKKNTAGQLYGTKGTLHHNIK